SKICSGCMACGNTTKSGRGNSRTRPLKSSGSSTTSSILVIVLPLCVAIRKGADSGKASRWKDALGLGEEVQAPVRIGSKGWRLFRNAHAGRQTLARRKGGRHHSFPHSHALIVYLQVGMFVGFCAMTPAAKQVDSRPRRLRQSSSEPAH